ncbi:superoxide dismutase [Chlamydiifrater volucris]|uniref:superoxide dismutase n=1 Tax=Chlamydiifrater volucris TaxID=2681470 RepID=UPI001FE9E628|nr:superoxide dismutase [Chlamydiifrater volucris]
MELMKFRLPELPYEYEDLEPVISAEIMQLHHLKHHQGYVNNLNDALKKMDISFSSQEVTSLISLAPALRFNGGGHINHSLFWEMLSPEKANGGVPPQKALLRALEARWGNFDNFLKSFIEFAAPIQGSGWAWLALCPKTKNLTLQQTANQDPLEGTTGLVPLLGVDVWEHAYYLQYKNVRMDYLKAITKVFNWKYVESRYINFLDQSN